MLGDDIISEVTVKTNLYISYTNASMKYNIFYIHPLIMDKFLNNKMFVYSIPSNINRKFFVSSDHIHNITESTQILSLYTNKHKNHFCFRNVMKRHIISKKSGRFLCNSYITLQLISSKKEFAKIKLIT